jgi:hypothetical protein
MITAPGVFIILRGSSPQDTSKELIIPFDSRSCVKEYVLISKLIHIGSITSIICIFCDDTLHLLRKYANGYARMSVMMVAITEYTTDKRNVSAYSESEVMFEKVKLPLSSVKA